MAVFHLRESFTGSGFSKFYLLLSFNVDQLFFNVDHLSSDVDHLSFNVVHLSFNVVQLRSDVDHTGRAPVYPGNVCDKVSAAGNKTGMGGGPVREAEIVAEFG